MKVNVTIEIPDQQWLKLTSIAYSFGWAREDPRKSWSEREKKEALRYVTKKLLLSKLNLS